MIVSFPAKDGNGYLQFDLSRKDFSPEHIKKHAKGVASIRLADGEIYDVPADQFSEEHAAWLRENMTKDHMHPRDADASLFSRDAGLAVKEQLMEFAGGSLSADTTLGRAGQAVGKIGTQLLEHATDFGFTARKAALVGTGEFGKKVRPIVEKDREKTKEFFDKAYESMGGRDVYSGTGKLIGEGITMGGAYNAVRKVALKAVPALAPRAGQTILTALKAGDFPMTARLLSAAKVAGFEGGVAAPALAGHRLAAGGTVEEAATEGLMGAGLAGGLAGVGAATFGVRAARKQLARELSSKIDDAVETAAKKEVGMRLLQAAQDKPITDPRRMLAAPKKQPYTKPDVIELKLGEYEMSIQPEPFTGEYLKRGTISKTREAYRQRTPAEKLSDFEFEPTSPEAYMSLAQQRPGEAGFIKLPWYKRADDIDDAVAAVATKSTAREFIARQAAAAISDIMPLKSAMKGAVGEETYIARKTLSGAAAEAQMGFKYGKYAINKEGLTYQTTKESMGTWTIEPLIEKMGFSKVKQYKKIDGMDGNVYLHQYRTGRMLAGEVTENPEYVLPKGWTRERIRTIKARHAALAEADPALYAAVKEADARTNRFYNLVLREMYEAGRIGKGDYANITAHYKKYGYHPLRRKEDINVAEQYFSGSKVAPKLKKRTAKGTEKELLDSAEDMERYYITNHVANRKNKFFRDTADELVKNPETAELVEVSIVEKAGKKAVWTHDDISIKPLIESLGKNEYRYQRVVDGYAKTFTVKVKSDELFQAITTASIADTSMLAKAATIAAQVKRTSIIFTAAFLQRSTFKGGIDAAVQAQWARPVRQLLKENGIAGIFSKEFANANIMPWVLPKTWFENIAVATKTISGLNVRNALKAQLGPEGANLKYLNNYLVQHGGGGMVGEGGWGVLENSWRNHAAYKLLRESVQRGEDVTTPQFAQRMALLRRELGGDYMEKGFQMRKWGSKIPFLNASVAGLRSNFRRMIEDPIGMTLRMGQVAVAPAVIGFALMKDDPEYQALTPMERVSRIYYAPGMWLPRPYGLTGFVHFALEEKLREMYATSPTDTRAWLSAAQYAFISTPIPSWMDSAATTFLGWSVFQGRMIEPEWMKRDLPPEQRVGLRSTATARAISEAVPIASPLRIDATVDAILGPLGNTAMQLSSVPMAAARGETPPAKHISTNRFIETGTRVPPTERASGYVNATYDLTKQLNNYEKRLKVATPDRRKTLKENNQFLVNNKSRIKSMRKATKDAQAFEREVTMGEKLKGYTADQKTEKIRAKWSKTNEKLSRLWGDIEESRRALKNE